MLAPSSYNRKRAFELEIATGKVTWQDRTFPKVNMIHTGDRTILLDEDGVLHLAALSPDGLKVVSKFQLLESVSWTPPSIAGTRLYVRDRKSIAAVELK
jgi:hypothetical protein